MTPGTTGRFIVIAALTFAYIPEKVKAGSLATLVYRSFYVTSAVTLSQVAVRSQVYYVAERESDKMEVLETMLNAVPHTFTHSSSPGRMFIPCVFTKRDKSRRKEAIHSGTDTSTGPLTGNMWYVAKKSSLVFLVEISHKQSCSISTSQWFDAVV